MKHVTIANTTETVTKHNGTLVSHVSVDNKLSSYMYNVYKNYSLIGKLWWFSFSLPMKGASNDPMISSLLYSNASLMLYSV